MRKICCKKCKTYFIKPESDLDIIRVLGVNLCSKSCRRAYIAMKNNEKKEKLMLKKQKVKIKKQSSISFLTKKADKLWSECVKIRDWYKCQYCDKTEYLNSHHLFTRARKSTRWVLNNGITLCSWHHTLSSTFSAHQTWLEFFEWLEKRKGREWIDKLSRDSQAVIKVTPAFIQERIEWLELYKKCIQIK